MGATLSRSSSREGDISHGLVWEREEDFLQFYELEKKIGEGGMGEVWIVSRKRKHVRLSQRVSLIGGKRKFAMKTIHTNRISKSLTKEIRNEIAILKELDHPNIIRLFEVYTFKRKIYLLMELCTGGNIGEREYTEHRVADVMKQILQGLACMHHMSICHRDVKMENILFESKNSWNIKLIDFGLSMNYIRGNSLKKACGTIYTVAPEVIFGNGYTQKADMWSVGVIAYILLSGKFPFLAKDIDLQNKEKMVRFSEARISLTGPEWETISQHGKDFVLGLIRRRVNTRWAANEALSFITRNWLPTFGEMSSLKDGVNSPYSKENSDEENIGSLTPSDSLNNLYNYECTPNEHSKITVKVDHESNHTNGHHHFNHDEDEDDDYGHRNYEDYDHAPNEDQFESHKLENGSSDDSTDENEKKDKIEKSESNISLHSSSDPSRRRTSYSKIFNSIRAFSEYGEMKRTALMVIASVMDRTQISWLREAFLEMDTEQYGIISYSELKEAMERQGLDDETIQRAFESMDVTHSGSIKYMEFIAATLEARGFIEEERLMEAFDRLDTSNTGFISCENLKKIMGTVCDKKTLQKMIAQVDSKNQQQIDFDEFLEMFSDTLQIVKSETASSDNDENLDNIENDVTEN